MYFSLRTQMKVLGWDGPLTCLCVHLIFLHIICVLFYRNLMTTTAVRKTYQCDICQRDFSDRSNRHRHVQAIHNKIRHSCESCKKDFSSKCNLHKHIKTIHNGERYQCSLCGNQFTAKLILTKILSPSKN